MMEQPEQKRPRLSGPEPPQQWQHPPERHLPPPPQHQQQQHPALYPPPHSTPFRPEVLPSDRNAPRAPDNQQDPRDAHRPSTGPHAFQPSVQQPQYPPPAHYAGEQQPPIKRDPADEPQMGYRPPSTGSGPEAHVNGPMHQDPSGRFHTAPPFDPARQAAYPPPSPYGPPAPNLGLMSGDLNYGPHNIYGNNGLPGPRPDQFSVTYSQAGRPMEQQVRKKAQRAAQACDNCRTLKSKCDEARPACSSCREKNQECKYRDPPPKQQDKASQDIIDSLTFIKETMSSFQRELHNLSTQVNSLTKSGPHFTSSPTEHSGSAAVKQDPTFDVRRASESDFVPSNGEIYHASPTIVAHPPPRALSLPLEMLESDGEENEGEDRGPTKPPTSSIPVNHTTGAATLLLVKPIEDLCKEVLYQGNTKKQITQNFPFRRESTRGLLRLFGRGEGDEHTPMYDKNPTMDHLETTPGGGQSEASSPATGEEWGQIGGLTPPGGSQDVTRPNVGPDGMPDFSPETVRELVNVFKAEINNMHPLFIPRQLDQIVERFLKSIPSPKQKYLDHLQHDRRSSFSKPLAHFANNRPVPDSPGTKRKRSPGGGGEFLEPQASIEHKPGHPFRNITAAIVMLCMALGKICQHKGKFADVYTNPGLETTQRTASLGSLGSPIARNGLPPSPLQSSPSMSAPFSTASPYDEHGQARSRRQSVDVPLKQRHALNPKPKNMDVIPGLAYFALATDVIGNQLGGNSLQHVHVNLLAGLYHGQLARVMESHAYIAAAGRALQVILRPKMARFKAVLATSQFVRGDDNPLIFAFWTCLQLESDIVAELAVPRSGILTYEEDMPGPNVHHAVEEDKFDKLIIESYIAQLFLRKHLNQLHNMFYNPSIDDTSFQSVTTSAQKNHFSTIEACEGSLAIVKNFAPSFQWDSSKGEPARDILGARLRAKFYGAEVITYRNFILKILDPGKEKGTEVSANFKPEIQDELPTVSPRVSSFDDIDPKVRGYVRRGLRALIASTKAFHGLGDPTMARPIVTNVWGTAHAQWGNMLTLQAVWCNDILGPILQQMLTVEEMTELLIKTLGFLYLVATPSSALMIDYKILHHAGVKCKFLPPYPGSGGSFCSNSTVDIPMSAH